MEFLGMHMEAYSSRVSKTLKVQKFDSMSFQRVWSLKSHRTKPRGTDSKIAPNLKVSRLLTFEFGPKFHILHTATLWPKMNGNFIVRWWPNFDHLILWTLAKFQSLIFWKFDRLKVQYDILEVWAWLSDYTPETFLIMPRSCSIPDKMFDHPPEAFRIYTS